MNGKASSTIHQNRVVARQDTPEEAIFRHDLRMQGYNDAQIDASLERERQRRAGTLRKDRRR